MEKELDPLKLREAGCNCDFSCWECGNLLYHENECPMFSICPSARKPAYNCPVHGTEEIVDGSST